ncbi:MULTISPECIES: hypothetical protein [unclassified Rathayibacter]|uniref:hypothetical protein n=1 Tax=unclassified Rathayibacter TaxID=2609250 RepID=UPI0012E8C6CD|nr:MULTISPECIES: hypothetical protein [unclassified Rathayibacter]
MAVLTGLVLSACTAPASDEAEATPVATATATATERPIGPVDLPDDATAVVEWVDEVGPVEPQTVRLVGEPLHVTVSVVCDTADATVTVAIDGLMTTGSSCIYDPATTRTTSNGGGNTGSMQIAVDQDALVTVTTEPADAHWSGAISTGPLTVPAG